MTKKLLLVLLFNPVLLVAQKKADRQVATRLEKLMGKLTEGIPQGRRTGTSGELLAAQLIATQFQGNGLKPLGKSGDYFQPFSFSEGNEMKNSTFLKINGQNIPVAEGFLPLPFSANLEVTGDPIIGIQEQESPWIIAIRKIPPGSSKNPRPLLQLLRNKAKEAVENGATAVIFYSMDTNPSGLRFDPWQSLHPMKVPVFYIRRKVAGKYFQDESAKVHLEVNVNVGEKISWGQNVLGYIDNHAPYTIIIGTHYDHPGWDPHNPLNHIPGFYQAPPEDNAGGTAALIELTRMLNFPRYRNSNYLFICFSGEEFGLLGSSYFIRHPTLNLGQVKYMINLIFPDSLEQSIFPLEINGIGSSPAWSGIFHQLKDKRLKITLDNAIGHISDQAVFFQEKIPVLAFHDFPDAYWPHQVHQPGLSMEAWPDMLQYLCRMIFLSNRLGKLAFSP